MLCKVEKEEARKARRCNSITPETITQPPHPPTDRVTARRCYCISKTVFNVNCKYMFSIYQLFSMSDIDAKWQDRFLGDSLSSPHIGCVCLTFLHCVYSNWSNWYWQRIRCLLARVFVDASASSISSPRFHDKVILEEELNALRFADHHCNR